MWLLAEEGERKEKRGELSRLGILHFQY